MFNFLKIRKPGPTELTWEEKNSADYVYHNEVVLKCFGDIKYKLPEIIPDVGGFVFVVKSTRIADPRKREVLYKNCYGVLCQWQEEVSKTICHMFFEFKFYTFRKWQKF